MTETQLIIIQPTPQCNINCHYCYLPERTSRKRIEMETIDRIGEAFFKSAFVGEAITIVWHAGEPLVLPIGFYEEALDRLQAQNRAGVRIEHCIQTNATRITQQWCDFFLRRNVQVGISLDGPQFIHDTHRVDRGGRGTFERVMKGVRLLQRNEIPFAVIAVITEQTLPYAYELWDFFRELRPRELCFNPEEEEGIHRVSSLHTEERRAQYRQFLHDFLAYNTRAGTPLQIREFELIQMSIRMDSPWSRSQTNIPGAIFSFDCDGNISTFSPEILTIKHANYGTFHFGNVFTHTLEQALKSQKCLRVNKEIRSGIVRCLQSCEYFMFCGGGFPSNKLSEHNTFDVSETQACRLRVKVTVDVLLEYLEEKYHLNA